VKSCISRNTKGAQLASLPAPRGRQARVRTVCAEAVAEVCKSRAASPDRGREIILAQKFTAHSAAVHAALVLEDGGEASLNPPCECQQGSA